MNTKKFSDAMSEIGDKYINEAINYKYKRKKQSGIKWVITAACLCFAAIGCVGFINLSKTNSFIEKEIPINQHSMIDATSTLESGTTEENKFYYSTLTNIHDVVNEDILNQFAANTSDIVAFDESMLKNCCAVIEGEITDIHLKNYSFTTSDDKFGEDGTLNYKVASVVYEIKATKVWYGEMKVGDIVTIEDELFFADEMFAIKVGHKYVIPIYEAGDEIGAFHYKELLSGDIQRDSIYSTVYSFHPQIEVVTEGYIVSTDWETLTSGEKSNIIMDVELGDKGSFYKDKMMLIPIETFSKQMDILTSSGKFHTS